MSAGSGSGKYAQFRNPLGEDRDVNTIGCAEHGKPKVGCVDCRAKMLHELGDRPERERNK